LNVRLTEILAKYKSSLDVGVVDEHPYSFGQARVNAFQGS